MCIQSDCRGLRRTPANKNANKPKQHSLVDMLDNDSTITVGPSSVIFGFARMASVAASPRGTAITSTSTQTFLLHLRERLVILRVCYRAQKPQIPKNTKQFQKKKKPGLAPEDRKKNRKNTETAPKFPFLYFLGVFGPQPGVGRFIFFCIFGILGFLGSMAGPQDHKRTEIVTKCCTMQVKITNCCKLSGRFFCRPLPTVPFGFHRHNQRCERHTPEKLWE